MKNIISNFLYYSVVIIMAVLAIVVLAIVFPTPETDTMEKTPDGFRYMIAYGGNSITITGYKGKAETIDIPEQIQGLPVTTIGYMAFDHCTKLKSITIPSSVTKIDDEAFANCFNLTSIVIPSSVTAIGNMVFDSCLDLTSIEIPSSVTSIGANAFSGCRSLASIEIPSSITSIGTNAFRACTSLTNITIPSSVISIKTGVFHVCSSLTSITVDSKNPAYASIDGVLFDKTIQTIVAYPNGKEENSYTIPSSVTSIENDAFSYSNRLTNITIPSSVTSIKKNPFFVCNSLTGITVDSQNPAFASIDGVLFDKAIQTIIAYPYGKNERTYIIPDSVTAIGDWSFWNNTSLTSMVIPFSVMSIGEAAFSICDNLEIIALPRHTQVAKYAFPYSAQIIYMD